MDLSESIKYINLLSTQTTSYLSICILGRWNEFIHIFRHHDYSHRMHLNFTFLWLYFLFSSEKSRFRLLTLRPSSFGLFWVHLQSRAPEKKKKMNFAGFFEIYKIYIPSHRSIFKIYRFFSFFFFEKKSQNHYVGILQIFVEIGHFRSDFDENLAEFHEIF